MPMRIGKKVYPTKQEAYKALQKRLAYWWDEKSGPVTRESLLVEALSLPVNVRGFCNPILVACLHCPWFEIPFLIRQQIQRYLRPRGRTFVMVS